MKPLDFIKNVQEQLSIRFRYGQEFMGDPEKIEVGLTERTLVLKNNNHSLYFYPGKQEQNKPLLLIYSLINRPYIFDLRPGRSMIEYLCNNGFDVYLIDWGYPSSEDAMLTLEDLVTKSIHRFTKYILKKYGQEKVDILGYCMGATFATMYAGYAPENINKMILLTPPLGNDEGGMLQKIANKIEWRNKINYSGIISGRMLKLFFSSIRPAITLKKERDFWNNFDKNNFMENFLPVEKWSNDTPDLPGKVFFEFLDICFSKDEMKKGAIKIGETNLDFTKVTLPVFSVAAEHDWIIPSASLENVKLVLPNAQHETYLLPGGHIGLVVGRTAVKLWDRLKEFLA
jgi:polyhydroxyalkanoate synthase